MTRDPLIDRRLGPWRISARLGSGGAGLVYRAHDITTGEAVALKILQSRWADNGRVRKRFVREGMILREVRHPGVPRFIELRRLQSTLVLVQTLAPGEPLDAILKREPTVHARRCVPWFLSLLEVLSAVHAAGIIHRDVKPQNLIIGPGRVTLIDFGLARMLGRSRLTLRGKTVGTPHYLSAEQACGERVDARTDVYSVGVTLFQTLTGRLPFDNADRRELFKAILTEQVPSPNAREPIIDPRLEGIVLKALARDPEQRYQSAAEMAEALRGWIASRHTRRIKRARALVRRRRKTRTRAVRKLRAQATRRVRRRTWLGRLLSKLPFLSRFSQAA